MQYITIYDNAIKYINIQRKANESSNIIYYDRKKQLHIIDFDICAANYHANNSKSLKCIAERNINEFYFIFYTNDIKTKIIFKKHYVFFHFLKGSKIKRFHKLEKIISDANYTTYDLS